MGLIRAAVGAAGGTFADQWREFFYCDSMDKDVLVVRGEKKVSGRSSNTRGNDNIISNGSVISVADGQCMIIVEQGKVVEICAESGEFTYDSSTEPSIFTGDLGEGIKQTFLTIGKRFTFGGDAAKDQRVYYVNTKEIMDNKFGTANPIPFRVVDRNIGLDIDVSVRCNGVYSYKIADPITFYTNVCGNVEIEYTRQQIDNQLKTEFISALQPAFAKLSDMEIRPNALPAHTEELSSLMNKVLTDKWFEKRGLAVESIAMNPPTLPEEDAKMIKELQRAGTLRNPAMAAATIAESQAAAMKMAASNENGAMMGFMGMGMAQQAGGVNVQDLFAMGQQQAAAQQTVAQQAAPTAQQPAQDIWKCSCGNTTSGKFCPECGSPKPADEGWVCQCGQVNKGKFCQNCGSKKPESAPLYRCDKCGWEPEDPHNPPKFCPECGDPFNGDDIKR